MKFLENLFNSEEKKSKRRLERFRKIRGNIENFLYTVEGYSNSGEKRVYTDDGRLIDEAGKKLLNIIFKYYPRFKSSREKEDSTLESKREKKEAVCNLAVSLIEFLNLYLENPRVKDMDYGIADRNLPVYNPDAPESEKNSLSEKDQFIIYEEKLENGVRDIELKDIQNYSISYACRIIEEYSEDFLKYLSGKEFKKIIQTSNQLKLIEEFKNKTFRELLDVLQRLPKIQNLSREHFDYIKKLLKRYESEKQELIKAGISEKDIPGKEESKKLWDFVASKGSSKTKTIQKPDKKPTSVTRTFSTYPNTYPTPVTGTYVDKSLNTNRNTKTYTDPFEEFKKTRQIKK